VSRIGKRTDTRLVWTKELLGLLGLYRLHFVNPLRYLYHSVSDHVAAWIEISSASSYPPTPFFFSSLLFLVVIFLRAWNANQRYPFIPFYYCLFLLALHVSGWSQGSFMSRLMSLRGCTIGLCQIAFEFPLSAPTYVRSLGLLTALDGVLSARLPPLFNQAIFCNSSFASTLLLPLYLFSLLGRGCRWLEHRDQRTSCELLREAYTWRECLAEGDWNGNNNLVDCLIEEEIPPTPIYILLAYYAPTRTCKSEKAGICC